MAEKKYLNLEGLQDVAGHVNTRLKTVTTIPASADDGAVRLYVGETGVTYKKGHIYQYNSTDSEWVDITGSSQYTAGNGIDITNDEISVETYIFTGTQAQWNALTTEQKQEYQICNITDDGSADEAIYTKSEIDAMLGTAASKDATDIVRPNDHDLVESNAVYSAINNALSSVYTPRGDLTCAELTSALLIEANVGNVYQMTDSGTTSALFINGAGKTINVNDNVGIIKAGADTYMFNLMGNAFDLHDYQKKDLTSAIEGQTTVEGALGALSTNKADADDVYTKTEADALLDDKVSYEDNGILGAKNIYEFVLKSQTSNNVQYTVNSNKSIGINVIARPASNTGVIIGYANLKAGIKYYISSGLNSADDIRIDLRNSDYSMWQGNTDAKEVMSPVQSWSIDEFIPTSDVRVMVYARVGSGGSTGNIGTVYPMIALNKGGSYQEPTMTNQQITPYVQAISNPNLLDNPWFTINQRGQSSYTSDWVYTVDRWLKGESYTLSVGNNGISASVINIDHGHLSQRLDIYNNLVGKTCTLSILKSTGEISSATGVVLSGIGTSMAISDNDIWCALVKDANFDFIALNFKNTTTTVRAVKLELGSVSTLAMDTAPNTATELLKCQRYFVRYTGAGYPEICHAIESSGLNAWGLCFLPVPMRIKPSIAFANVNAYRLSDDSATAITAMEIHALANNACKIMFTLASNGINGAVAEIQPNSASNGYVDFSADL